MKERAETPSDTQGLYDTRLNETNRITYLATHAVVAYMLLSFSDGCDIFCCVFIE